MRPLPIPSSWDRKGYKEDVRGHVRTSTKIFGVLWQRRTSEKRLSDRHTDSFSLHDLLIRRGSWEVARDCPSNTYLWVERRVTHLLTQYKRCQRVSTSRSDSGSTGVTIKGTFVCEIPQRRERTEWRSESVTTTDSLNWTHVLWKSSSPDRSLPSVLLSREETTSPIDVNTFLLWLRSSYTERWFPCSEGFHVTSSSLSPKSHTGYSRYTKDPCCTYSRFTEDPYVENVILSRGTFPSSTRVTSNSSWRNT